MQIGIAGLGKMGYPLALNLRDKGHEVVAYNRSAGPAEAIRREGIWATNDLGALVAALDPPRTIWVMVPAGAAVDSVLTELANRLAPGDIVIDGGNSHYKDSMRRAAVLGEKGIGFADVGTSGGVEGARNGVCVMVGASDEVFCRIGPLLASIAVENGCLHTGAPGSGHYVKMIHNGIEYGMMQAIGEGFELLAESPFDLDLPAVADVYCHGSVIRGWLMELAASLLSKDPDLSALQGVIGSSGEGLWTVQEALERGVAAPITVLSLMARSQSQRPGSFGAKIVAGLRDEFGGHGYVSAESATGSESGEK